MRPCYLAQRCGAASWVTLLFSDESDMSEMPRSLYVYYRVPREQQAAVRSAVEAIQRQLQREHPGLSARLMRRADEGADASEATWMEIYEHAAGVSIACEQSLKALMQGLPPALMGARHTEVFCQMAGRSVGAA